MLTVDLLEPTLKLQAVLAAHYEEYRALYSLVELRMSAMDRRLPVTAAAFAGAVASLQSVPPESQVILFAGLPIALIGFMRSAVNHARSKEDVLRRIEQIERSVNELLGQSVLRFQSRHPNRRRHVGGRTSRETVLAVLTTILLLLIAAAFQATQAFSAFSDWQILYVCFLAITAIAASHEVVRLAQYSYLPSVELERVSEFEHR